MPEGVGYGLDFLKEIPWVRMTVDQKREVLIRVKGLGGKPEDILGILTQGGRQPSFQDMDLMSLVWSPGEVMKGGEKVARLTAQYRPTPGQATIRASLGVGAGHLGDVPVGGSQGPIQSPAQAAEAPITRARQGAPGAPESGGLRGLFDSVNSLFPEAPPRSPRRYLDPETGTYTGDRIRPPQSIGDVLVPGVRFKGEPLRLGDLVPDPLQPIGENIQGLMGQEQRQLVSPGQAQQAPAGAMAADQAIRKAVADVGVDIEKYPGGVPGRVLAGAEDAALPRRPGEQVLANVEDAALPGMERVLPGEEDEAVGFYDRLYEVMGQGGFLKVLARFFDPVYPGQSPIGGILDEAGNAIVRQSLFKQKTKAAQFEAMMDIAKLQIGAKNADTYSRSVDKQSGWMEVENLPQEIAWAASVDPETGKARIPTAVMTSFINFKGKQVAGQGEYYDDILKVQKAILEQGGSIGVQTGASNDEVWRSMVGPYYEVLKRKYPGRAAETDDFAQWSMLMFASESGNEGEKRRYRELTGGNWSIPGGVGGVGREAALKELEEELK